MLQAREAAEERKRAREEERQRKEEKMRRRGPVPCVVDHWREPEKASKSGGWELVAWSMLFWLACELAYLTLIYGRGHIFNLQGICPLRNRESPKKGQFDAAPVDGLCRRCVLLLAGGRKTAWPGQCATYRKTRSWWCRWKTNWTMRNIKQIILWSLTCLKEMLPIKAAVSG